MTLQEINKRIQTLRMITEQQGLHFHQWKLDAIGRYLEAQHPVISVVGAKSSGKCAMVNSLLGTDLLPSQIFKPRCLYSVSRGEGQPKVKLSTGETLAINSLSALDRYVKHDYDATACVETMTGILENHNLEIKTGFDTDNSCPILDYMLSDIVLVCVKATALFSLDDIAIIEDLKATGHRKMLLCITHVNNVSPQEIPEIVRFVKSKHLGLPTAYFTDEPLANVHGDIQACFGVDYINRILAQYLADGIDNKQRTTIASAMLHEVIDSCLEELTEERNNLEQEKNKKYTEHLAKIAKKESMRLGWTDIRTGYEKLESKCIDTILADLNKAKGKMFDRMQASILSTQNPKEWWEKMLPLSLKNEIEGLSSAIDTKLQSQVIKDFNWLNHEIQMRFRQSVITTNTSVGETQLDYTLDINSQSFNNLRTARYITMAGGATLATAMFFVVGPVGALASASCGIIGDRYIHKVIEGQRESLKNAVANVIDDVIAKMASMIPIRVSTLYEEIARGIAEKEQAWSDAFALGEFICEESPAIEKLDETIHSVQNLKIE